MSNKKYSKSVKKTKSKAQALAPQRKNWLAIAATFYAMWMTILCPLYLEDQYFNLRDSKGHIFLAGAFLSMAFVIVAALKEKTIKPLLPTKDVTELSLTVFAAFGIISALLSGAVKDSLFGSQCWWFGGIAMFAFALFVILMSNTISFGRMLRNTMLTIGFIVMGIGLIHACGVDFMYLHRYMEGGYSYGYLSTIGNINWYQAYMCLTFPLVAILFMQNDDKEMDTIYLPYMFLGAMNLIFTGCDGLYVGIGVCAFFVIPFVFSKLKRFRRFMLIVAFYGLAALMIIYLPVFDGMQASIGGLCAIFLKPIVAWGITLVGTAGYIVSRKLLKEFKPQHSKIIIIVCEALLIAAVIYFLIDTIRNFNDEWGSGRGQIWRYTVEFFGGMPFFNKLIGMGPETLHIHNVPLSNAMQMNVLANHSDFLQLLITNGIIGVGAWITMWGSIIYKQIKHGNMDDCSFAFFATLMCYMGQSTVNTIQGMTTGMLSVLMGIYLGYARKNKKNNH